MKFCKMKRFFSGFKKTLPFVLIFAVVFAVAFYPRSKEEGKSEEVKSHKGMERRYFRGREGFAY